MDAIAELAARLSADRVSTAAADLEHYGRDWTRWWTPTPLAIAFPESIAEVQAIVRWAIAHRIAIVPSGGRTGLSGGAVAAHGELVVSFERMHRILGFDPLDRTLTVEAGVVTETVQNAAREHGLIYPVDFGSRGSSQIGGNIATNAGGIRVIRYGMTRAWVSGLKVVTGTGELLDLNRGLVKNATGYDLRHLMIGSEGTLGLIVEATLQLTDPPRDPQRPFEGNSPCYVLLEYENLDAGTEAAALAAFEEAMQQGWLTDGVMAQSQAQAAELWRFREGITESVAKYTPYKNDVSVRVAKVPAFLADMDALFAREYPDFEVVWFGHVGDGNLHVSVLKPEAMAKADFEAACERVTGQLCDVLTRHGGSISAEHGVGLLKKPYLSRVRSAPEIALMRQLKQVFDPHGLMNPGKLLDA